MGQEHGRKGAAKVKHLGRRKAQIQRYYEKVYAKRKLRHLLLNNGVAAARSWADKRNEQVNLRRAADELRISI